MQEISSSDFQSILSDNGPFVLDIWASWCGPCTYMAPVLDELSRGQYERPVRFYKSNVDENPDLARRFNVMSIPTLLFFDNGQVVGTLLGAAPKDKVREKMADLLGA